jgi:hypothetical protein
LVTGPSNRALGPGGKGCLSDSRSAMDAARVCCVGTLDNDHGLQGTEEDVQPTFTGAKTAYDTVHGQPAC